MAISDVEQRPAELLDRYRGEVYPPLLSEAEQTALQTYLEEQGFEPRVGVVACEPRLPLQSLVKMAMAEFGLQRENLADEDIVVGPHSLGMPNAISLWTPIRIQSEEPGTI